MAVARQDISQGHAEHSGGHQQQRAQQQGIAKGFKVVRVFEEFDIVVDAPTASGRYFKTFHHQIRQRVKHEKGDDHPQDCCQRDVAARHLTSFPTCSTAKGQAMAHPVRSPPRTAEQRMTGRACASSLDHYGLRHKRSLLMASLQCNNNGDHRNPEGQCQQ